MKYYRVEVQVKGRWELMQPTGAAPYRFDDLTEAEDAAALYPMGLARVVTHFDVGDLLRNKRTRLIYKLEEWQGQFMLVPCDGSGNAARRGESTRTGHTMENVVQRYVPV